MPNLIVEFLSPYSRDYNLVELVWHSARGSISNRLFESVEKLELLLNTLFNKGGLIMEWD
jgi:transposase